MKRRIVIWLFVLGSLFLTLCIVQASIWIKMGSNGSSSVYTKERKNVNHAMVRTLFSDQKLDDNHSYSLTYQIKKVRSRGFFPLLRIKRDTLSVSLIDKGAGQDDK